jgi:hypothetical protein
MSWFWLGEGIAIIGIILLVLDQERKNLNPDWEDWPFDDE